MARRVLSAQDKLHKFVEFCTMEWMVPVNEMLRDEITRIDSNLMTETFEGDIRTVRMLQDSLSKLIDILGEHSSAAQGLKNVITTGDKLRQHPSHVVYILKDEHAKNGEGEAIGMLKIGRKHLFLSNDQGQVRELEPLCVLDFYVVHKRQRAGYGKKLFDYMLQDTQSDIHALAIDGPSPMMQQFLKRNYGLDSLIRQNNNFAVSPKIFTFTHAELNKELHKKQREVWGSKRNRAQSEDGNESAVTSQPQMIGRFAAPRPPSFIANVIHGRREQDSALGTEMVELRSPPEEREWMMGAAGGVQRAGGNAWGAGGGAQGAAGTDESTLTSPANNPQLTDRGYLDVKFYHNKLW